MANRNLTAAKKVKNDEFYTLFSDIEIELEHYKKHFAGKVVFCNCDVPMHSAFWRYFHYNFSELRLKKLISTHYNENRTTYRMEYEGGDDKDDTVGKIIPLEQNGDFRSPECIALLKQADIVVTNPPFSLFREYAAQLMEYDKKFIIIGSKNAITYKEFFPLLKDNRIWIGFHNVKAFYQPDGSIKKFGNIGWYTNLYIEKPEDEVVLWQHYYEDDGVTPKPESLVKYPKYDNYDAINVDKVQDIPCDYFGMMGVPITFLDKYNPSSLPVNKGLAAYFEILGMTNGRKFECVYPIKYYINSLQHNKDGTTENGSKVNTRACILKENPEGIYYTADNAAGMLEIVYARVLIKRRCFHL